MTLVDQCESQKIPLNSVDRHVGARLRVRRLLLRLDPDRLAAKLQISSDQLASLEEGGARISYEQLKRVAEILDVPERYFYFGYGSRGPEPQRRSWLREVDRWFRDHVSPHEGLFLKAAKDFTGNLDAARDLVHDVYTALLADDRWRSVDNPRAFVRRAVTNLALDRLKKKKVVKFDAFAEVDAVNFADAAPDAYQTLAGRERLELVMRALDKLPTQCRQVFIMRKIEDVSPAEIAARLKIEIKTVEGHLARGLVTLNKHLEVEGSDANLIVRVVTPSGTDGQRADDRSGKEKKR